MQNNQTVSPEQMRIEQVRRQVNEEAKFYRHAVTYVAVISALWMLNFYQVYESNWSTKRWAFWAVWPTIGWGIGLLSHAAGTFVKQGWFGQQWQEEKINQRLTQVRGINGK